MHKFNIGIVVCIDNNGFGGEFLTINKHYNVIFEALFGDYPGHNHYVIINDEGFEWNYDTNMFITLKEFRDNQIDKVL